MEHRAGPLLANRSLSALIVVSFVLSAFAGLYVIASPPPSAAQAPIGDLIVTSGTVYVIENIEQAVDGDVEVRTGGELIIRNGALKVISSASNPRTVTVLPGSTLTLEHGELTTYLNEIDPWPFLTVIVGGGTVVASDMSAFRFPGEIDVHSGGQLILRDSVTEPLSAEDLASIENSPYFLPDSVDDGPAITVDDSRLTLFDSAINGLPEYPSIGDIASNLTLTGSSTLMAVNSYISVDFGPKVQSLMYQPDWHTHNMLVVEDTSQAFLYGCYFDAYTGTYALRAPAIYTAVGAHAYVHRWLDVTIGDEYGVPIPGADISAVFTGVTEWEGDDLFYYTPTGTSPAPPTDVLNYLDKTAVTVFVTDSNGVSRIPFMTDVIANGGSVESVFVGSFAITGSTVIDSVPFSSTETFSFPAYPAMGSADQHFEMTVDVEGISAESPNTARWLVVPPDLLIEDMNYYHAGDVIVAADGTLIVRDSVFELVQAYPNERTVYVDGTASLIIEDSQVKSVLPINIIVKGFGTLHVINSVISGVDIIAMEDATVILDGAAISGSITTSWDSRAYVQILDSALAQAPVLSGSSFCEVTNTSAPAITVTDSATALIYRWIHITVFDGSNSPLEGADVYARFFRNDTFWASDTTDSSGVARLNSLATILTSSGSEFVGNYKVNASFWSGGVEYKSDETLNLGVLPYDQPLTENATFAVLKISSLLLPDLSVSSSSIWTTPSSVVANTTCTISVRVANVGAAPATDVVVDFYVGDTLLTADAIGSYTIALIMQGNAADATVPWTFDEVGRHVVWVQVNEGPDFDERTFVNNIASKEVTVLDYADLALDGVMFYEVGGVYPQESLPGGRTVSVRSELNNLGVAPVTNPVVTLTVTHGDTVDVVSETIAGILVSGGTFNVNIEYALPTVYENTEFNFHMSVNSDRLIHEWDYTNNNASADLLVLDIREDFKVSVSDVYIQYGVDNETTPVYGKIVTIVARVYNLGGTNPGNVSIEFGTDLYPNDPISVVIESIDEGTMREIKVNYLINITTGGTYGMYVFADSKEKYAEKNESNNRAEFDLEIVQLAISLDLSLATEYSAGEVMSVMVEVSYADTGDPVPSLRGVSISLRNSAGTTVVASGGNYSTPEGEVFFSLLIPSGIEGGDYTLVASVVGLTETATQEIEIHGKVSGLDIPWLVWILVIAAVVAVVVGFTLYTYVYGLGKLVECGECGEFIPAASKRCPKCGVEFEVGTMKCSECGTWVPAESTECPNCGVKFVGEEAGEEDYLEKMRKEYDEMVSKYRELAKAQLGRKFSDKTFEQWWMAQPIYISFEDWLAKEEEKRNEGPIACPVCGTLNPKEATVCNKCGTVFGAVRQAPPPQQPPMMPPGAGPEQAPPAAPVYQQPPADQAGQPPQAAAPKMVIRRPIDRKVVPKKVIKTPIEGQGEDSYDSGENQ